MEIGQQNTGLIPEDLEPDLIVTDLEEKSFNEKNIENGIALPERYLKYMHKNSAENDTNLMESQQFDFDDKRRQEDVTMALKWMKQELLKMKQHDRALMCQLLGLRATIRQLGGDKSVFRSGSNLSTRPMRGRSSFDYGCLSGPSHKSPQSKGDIMLSFQTRTVSLLNMQDRRMTMCDEACQPMQFGKSCDVILNEY